VSLEEEIGSKILESAFEDDLVENSMYEAEGTQQRATTNRDRKERMKWPASSEKKE